MSYEDEMRDMRRDAQVKSLQRRIREVEPAETLRRAVNDLTKIHGAAFTGEVLQSQSGTDRVSDVLPDQRDRVEFDMRLMGSRIFESLTGEHLDHRDRIEALEAHSHPPVDHAPFFEDIQKRLARLERIVDPERGKVWDELNAILSAGAGGSFERFERIRVLARRLHEMEAL